MKNSNYPLFRVTLMAWVSGLLFVLGPSLLSGALNFRTILFSAAVLAIMAVPFAFLYFYRRYYLWFAAIFGLLAILLVRSQSSPNEEISPFEALSYELLPYSIASVIIIVIALKVAQSVFGASLVSDESDIVEQGLHPEKDDLWTTVLFLLVAVGSVWLVRLLY